MKARLGLTLNCKITRHKATLLKMTVTEVQWVADNVEPGVFVEIYHSVRMTEKDALNHTSCFNTKSKSVLPHISKRICYM